MKRRKSRAHFCAYRRGLSFEIGTSLLSSQRLSSLSFLCDFAKLLEANSRTVIKLYHARFITCPFYVSVHLWPHLSVAYCRTVPMPDYNFPLYRLFRSFLHPFLPNPRPIPPKHSLDQLLHEIIFVCFMGCVEKAIKSTAVCLSSVGVRGSETDIWIYELCHSEFVKKFRGLPAQPDFKEV